MDLELPEMSGIEAIVEIRREFPEARILVLTTYKRAVHAGRKRVPAEIAIDIIEHHSSAPLTTREIEVLRLIAVGNANKVIAAELHVAEETVKGHVRNILTKLGANDSTHAVTIALKRGILHLETQATYKMYRLRS
jgi:DNA-binding NarL/FixJ family response regulator